MDSKKFIDICKRQVREYAEEHLDKSDVIPEFEVFDVWNCKALQNNKALLSTTLFDGMYYELTYNGDKKELYFDAYKKFENKCIKIEEEEDSKVMNEKAKYTEVNEEQLKRIDDTRNIFSTIYDYLESACKPSRETSLALNKLEEAQFWAIKGISREN